MIPTPEPDYNSSNYYYQQIFNRFKQRENSQPVIGNPVVTSAIIGVNNAITPPIASVVTPLVNGAGNVISGASSIVKFAAIGLGAIVLLKIMK